MGLAMRYYPVNLDIRNRRCLVVGGGPIGSRKTLALLGCGASVTVVSPDATERLVTLSDNREIELKRRTYRSSDPKGMFLVIGATDDDLLNRQVHDDAERLGILCNIADRPEICSFILPAVVNRGDLVIAISTSGKSPAFAKQLRLELAERFGDEYAEFLELMGAIRRQLLSRDHAPKTHKPLFEQLISGNLVDLVKKRDKAGIDKLLAAVLGDEYKYARLMADVD